MVWFPTGDYRGEHGDIARFFAGAPTAGTFMTGFFPTFMFALSAAAPAIYHCAKPSQRKIVGGIMLSTALTSFLTGVTEPLEFSFIFVARPLLLIHVALTGTSMAPVNALGIHDGFGFSAGAIDYLLNFGIAIRPLWLIPIGLGYAILCYFPFRFVITEWSLPTPVARTTIRLTRTVPRTATSRTTQESPPTAAIPDLPERLRTTQAPDTPIPAEHRCPRRAKESPTSEGGKPCPSDGSPWPARWACMRARLP